MGRHPERPGLLAISRSVPSTRPSLARHTGEVDSQRPSLPNFGPGSSEQCRPGRPHAGHQAECDESEVTALLGRAPRAAFEVVVRDDQGAPVVIRNDPFLDDGTPMPTRWWLVGQAERDAVSKLEATGGVRAAQTQVAPSALAEAHRRYAAERDAAVPQGHRGPRPTGGVGGTREGVKCLHAHLAWYLAGGEDPVGAWVAEQLELGAGSGRR